MKQALYVLVLLTVLIGLIGCTPTATEEAASPTATPGRATSVPPTSTPQPTELVIGLSADVESLDPFFVNQAAGWSVVHALFDHLIERDFAGDLVPGLAESWDVVDEQTLRFHLRHGVTFHNGEPFDAEAVRFSVERMLTEEEAPNRSKFTAIDSVEVVDDYTVLFHLNRPDGTLFDSLTSRLAMLPPRYFQEVGPEGFAAAPVGTGPFRFVEWVPDDHLTLVANENYWEGSYKGRAAVDVVTFRPIPEAATRVNELLVGGVDIIQDVPPDQIDDLEAAGLTVVTDEAYQLQYVFFVADDPSLPTYDIRVRQALNYAVDVDTIIATVGNGIGSRIASPIGPGYLGYDPTVTPYPYDPALARQLLAEAGYPDGFQTTLDVTDRTEVVEAVAGYLADVGVNVTIQEFELGQFNQNWMNRTQSMLWAARWGNTPDPQSIEMFASCNGWISRYCNEEVTAHLEAARDTLDQERRAAEYAAASRLLHDDPLAIYVSTTAQIYGLRPGVQGFRPSPLLVRRQSRGKPLA
jgi:peptide/nickel transport system substrate-binding protein